MTTITPPSNKKDAVTAALERGALWLVARWQQAALALAAGAAAAALGVVLVQNLRKVRRQGWEQLSQAHAQIAQGDRAAARSTLDTLLSAQRAGPLSIQARLLKGDLQADQGEADQAALIYQEALDQAGPPELKALSLARLAGLREQTGQWPEAETLYAKFIEQYPEHFLTGRTYLGLGRVRAAQKKDTDARAAYERLILLYPSTSWADQARAGLALLPPEPPAPPAPKP